MKTRIICAVCSVCLAFAAPALATSPTQGAYSGPGASQLSQVQDNSSQGPTVNSASSGSLPFTGLSLPILAIVAVTMIGAGVALRFKGHISDS